MLRPPSRPGLKSWARHTAPAHLLRACCARTPPPPNCLGAACCAPTGYGSIDHPGHGTPLALQGPRPDLARGEDAAGRSPWRTAATPGEDVSKPFANRAGAPRSDRFAAHPSRRRGPRPRRVLPSPRIDHVAFVSVQSFESLNRISGFPADVVTKRRKTVTSSPPLAARAPRLIQ